MAMLPTQTMDEAHTPHARSFDEVDGRKGYLFVKKDKSRHTSGGTDSAYSTDAEGELKSYDVVEAYIARIKECNPILNFMVTDRFNEALDEAKKIDEMLDSGDISDRYSEKNAPFLGVPLSVKEAFAVVGGEGCILGAGASVIGIGSDIGGSIRMPSFFNGVFGHRPTSDVVLNDGQFPCTQGMMSTGPMCRYAVDLEPLLRIMAGPHGVAKLKLDDHVDLRKLRYFSMGDNFDHLLMSKLDPELKEVQNKVVEYLQETLDIEVNRSILRRMRNAVGIWSAKMTVNDDVSFTTHMGNNGPRVFPSLELLKWFVGLSNHTIPAIMLGLTEDIGRLWPDRTQRLVRSCDKLLEEIKNMLGNDSVLIYPSHPKLAPFHHAPLLYPSNFAPTGIFNALNWPTTQVPLGLSCQGLPLGIQVVANRHNDHLCLVVARELEKGFGGWTTPVGMGRYHEAIENGSRRGDK